MEFSTASDRKSACDALSPEPVEKLLEALRPRDALPVPDNLIVRYPIRGAETLDLSHSFDRAIFESASKLCGLKGNVIAFDLDDTLLNTNYICKEAWTFPPDLGPEPATVESIDYRSMRHPATYWIKGGWKLPRRMQYDSARYPFLRNPDVVAQLRPGALALLCGLKAAGATLVLATICARQRLDFLFTRMPALKEIFVDSASGRLLSATAEDLAQFSISCSGGSGPGQPCNIDADMEAQWKGGCRAHRETPLCFNIKSLPALHTITGIRRLDLLVDDSLKGAEVWERYGLERHFLQAPPLEPNGLAVPVLLDGIIARLAPEQSERSRGNISASLLREGYPWVRFEDPLYFPFVHKEDVLRYGR